MAVLAIETRTQDLERLEREFNRLSRAQQKNIVAGSALGSSIERSARRSRAHLQRMTRTARDLAIAVTGVGGAMGAVQTVIAAAKEDFRQFLQMQRDAMNAQQSMSDAAGKFIANNPQLQESEVRKWIDLAREQGAVLGKGGPQRVLRAATALRSGTPGADESTQVEALKIAIKQARIDPETDIGEFAKAIVKNAQSMSQNIKGAANTLAMYGARAGADIAALSSNMGKLVPIRAVSHDKITDILGVHAFLTGELGDVTGEESTTMTANLLSRIMKPVLKIGGKKIRLKGRTGRARLEELLDIIEGGNIDEDAAVRDLSRMMLEDQRTGKIMDVSPQLMRGKGGPMALGAMLLGRKRLEKTWSMIDQAAKSGELIVDRQYQTKMAVLAPAASQQAGLEQAGQTELAEQSDIIGGEWARAAQRIDAFRKQIGLTTGFDLTKGARLWAAQRARGVTPAQWEREERMRAFQRIAASRERPPPGIFGTGAWDEPIYAGPENIQEAARQALAWGAVSPKGGIDRFEAAVLRKVGLDDDTIQKLNLLWLTGNVEAYQKAWQKTITPLAEKIGEEVAKAITQKLNTAPAGIF